MRQMALTTWHGVLILMVVWGFFTAIVAGVERFISTWYAPALMPLIMLVALEAMITQRLVVRERQRFEEQLYVRLMELVVILLVVRLWSLAAQGQPLLETITPWLREPLQFFTGRFAEYFVWAFAAWGMTTLLTVDILDWNTDAESIGPISESIEREQLQNEWGQSVARYRRRYLTIVFVMLAAASLALYESDGPRTFSPAWLTFAVICGIVSGLLLQSEGRLSQLRRNWSIDNIRVDSGVSRRWGRLGVLMVIVLAIIAPLLGQLMLLAPPPPLVPVLNALLVVMTVIVSLVILLIGILLSPLIFLLSLLSTGEGSAAPAMPRIEPPQIVETRGDRPLWPALIFWGCVLLLIILALARYIRSRSDLREAIARWRIFHWLRTTAQEWWSDARGWVALAVTQLQRLRRRRVRPRSGVQGEGVQGQLRALYRRMRKAGTRRGVTPRLAQTPYEYSAELARTLPVVQEEVHGLTEAYVSAEYGPHPNEPAHLKLARRHWRRLQRWLLRSSTLRRRDARRPTPGHE